MRHKKAMRFSSFFLLVLSLCISLSLTAMDATPARIPLTPPLTPEFSTLSSVGPTRRARLRKSPYVKEQHQQPKEAPKTATCPICKVTFDAGLLLEHDKDICEKNVRLKTVQAFLERLTLGDDNACLARSRKRELPPTGMPSHTITN